MARRRGRRTTPTLGLALVIVLAIVVLLFLLAEDDPLSQPERQASEVARGTPLALPDGPVTEIGSGQVTRGPWWEVAFTEPIYPDDKANHGGGLDERLVALLDRATRTIDLAVYDFDLANVAEAMARAVQRGVRVRMVTDTDTLANTRTPEIQAAFAIVRRAGIPIVDDQRQGIMHHKFSVVDGEWIETGSWNYTTGDTYRLNNNQFIARSPELAANYTAEFEKMFVERRFGPNKAPGVPNPQVVIGEARAQNYFAPQDRVAPRVVDAINRQTRRSLFFLAFSFTHDGIAEAMLAKAQAGVTVEGVFETTGSNTAFSEFRKLKQAGLQVYQDGNPWIMHHKVIGLDDRVVVFGSFNFSNNADEINDENLLIVEEPMLAEAFRAEYERVAALARNPPARKR